MSGDDPRAHILRNAIITGNIKYVRQWVEKNGHDEVVNAHDDDGNTPLHLAVHHLCLKIQQVKLEDPQVQRLSERCWSEVNIIKELCGGCTMLDRNVCNRDGDAPWYECLRNNALEYAVVLEVLDWLLTRESSNVILDPYTGPLLHWAVHHRQWDFARLLFRKGVDIKQTDKYGETALHRATCCESTPEDVYRSLINDYTLNARKRLGIGIKMQTAIFNAACDTHLNKFAYILLEYNPDVDIKDKFGPSLLQKVCDALWGNVDMILFEKLIPNDRQDLYETLVTILKLYSRTKWHDCFPLLECLFFYVENIPAKSIEFKLTQTWTASISVCLDGALPVFDGFRLHKLDTLKQISYMLCKLCPSIHQIPQSATCFARLPDQRPNLAETISDIDAMWANYSGSKAPVTLQSQCGQVIREHVRCRRDVGSLGLPGVVLAQVTRSDMAEELWHMMEETSDTCDLSHIAEEMWGNSIGVVQSYV